MIKILPNGSTEVMKSKKYCISNGVISLFIYSPFEYYSRLLIGLNNDMLVKNISHSFYTKENDVNVEHNFSLMFKKNKVELIFDSNNIIYTQKLEIDENILKSIKENIKNLYDLNPCCTNNNPSFLLKDIRTCVNMHTTIIHTYSGEWDAVRQYIPLFIETLSTKFDDEVKRVKKVKEDLGDTNE